jgi:hypothetical protein
MILSLSANWKDDLRVFHKKNSALRDYLNVLGGVDAFSSSEFASRVKDAWTTNLVRIGQAFDPRTFIAGLAQNPVVQFPARIVRAAQGFF